MGFNVRACRAFAERALSQPPPEHVERAEPRGLRVARFVLPLNLCPLLNEMAEMPGWKRGKIKSQLLLLMRSQLPPVRLPMLAGRPTVVGIRFSSVESDPDGAFVKFAIDRLTAKHGGLGLIQDDKGSKLKQHTWWEPAPRSAGFVLLDLYQTNGVTK